MVELYFGQRVGCRSSKRPPPTFLRNLCLRGGWALTRYFTVVANGQKRPDQQPKLQFAVDLPQYVWPWCKNNNNNNRTERRNSWFLQSPHCAAINCLQHVRSSGSGAIVCKSRATHRALITCNLQCTTLAIKYDRVEIAFIWALFYWLKPLTDEGGEETGVPGENLWRRACTVSWMLLADQWYTKFLMSQVYHTQHSTYTVHCCLSFFFLWRRTSSKQALPVHLHLRWAGQHRLLPN